MTRPDLTAFAEALVGPLPDWQRRIIAAFRPDPWRAFRPRPPSIIREHMRPEDLR